jgi:hypothetical protein
MDTVQESGFRAADWRGEIRSPVLISHYHYAPDFIGKYTDNGSHPRPVQSSLSFEDVVVCKLIFDTL